MARRKYEFKPDKTGSGFLGKLYITRRQRLALLRWALYALVMLALSLVQDVILSRVSFYGATTDLVSAGILLLTMLLDPEEGAVFSLVASTFFYFSGSAPNSFDGGSSYDRTEQERTVTSLGAVSSVEETDFSNAAGSGVRPDAGSETVNPPPGAASSLATDCIELDARTFTRRATNAMPLRITPRSGLYIIVS